MYRSYLLLGHFLKISGGTVKLLQALIASKMAVPNTVVRKRNAAVPVVVRSFDIFCRAIAASEGAEKDGAIFHIHVAITIQVPWYEADFLQHDRRDAVTCLRNRFTISDMVGGNAVKSVRFAVFAVGEGGRVSGGIVQPLGIRRSVVF